MPGKPVAVNFQQLYPSNQPQLPKKMVLSYVFQVGYADFLRWKMAGFSNICFPLKVMFHLHFRVWVYHCIGGGVERQKP